MATARTIELRFPAAGVVRRLGNAEQTARQSAYPTPWCLNVFPADPLARRRRGGSRPGLTAVLTGALGESVAGLVALDTATAAGPNRLLAGVVDSALVVVDGTTVTTPTGILTTEAGGALATESGDELTASEGTVPAAPTLLLTRGNTVFALHTSGVEVMQATTGMTWALAGAPVGCTVGCVWRDRLVLASANGLFASRQGDPTDWEYGRSAHDIGRAVAWQLAEASEIGGAPTALIPHRDQWLLAATADTLWVVTGDPAAGGSLRCVARDVGCVGPQAWCKAGDQVVFLGARGLYSVGADGSGLKPLSEDRVPSELRASPATTLLGYYPETRGVFIFGTSSAWFYDLEGGGFWPCAFDADHLPTAVCRDGDSLLLVGADRVVRSVGGDDDDGAAISSHVLVGPFRTASAAETAIVSTLEGTLGVGSGAVAWRLVPGDSAEEAAENGKAAIAAFEAGTAYTTYVQGSGSLAAGPGRRFYTRVRAPWCVVWLQAVTPWAYEGLAVKLVSAGRFRA